MTEPNWADDALLLWKEVEDLRRRTRDLEIEREQMKEALEIAAKQSPQPQVIHHYHHDAPAPVDPMFRQTVWEPQPDGSYSRANKAMWANALNAVQSAQAQYPFGTSPAAQNTVDPYNVRP